MDKKRALLIFGRSLEEAPSTLSQRVLALLVMQRVEVQRTTLLSALHAVTDAQPNLVFDTECSKRYCPDLVILCTGQNTPEARDLAKFLAGHPIKFLDLEAIPPNAVSEHLRAALAPQAQSAHRPRNRFLRSNRRGNNTFDFAW